MLTDKGTKDAIGHQDTIFKIKQHFHGIALNRSLAWVVATRHRRQSGRGAGGPGDGKRGDTSHKILRAGMQGPASAAGAQHSEDIFHFHF